MSYAKKHWWHSKTLWFNAVSILVFSAQGMSGITCIPNDVLITIIAVGNAVLRAMTKEAIGK